MNVGFHLFCKSQFCLKWYPVWPAWIMFNLIHGTSTEEHCKMTIKICAFTYDGAFVGAFGLQTHQQSAHLEKHWYVMNGGQLNLCMVDGTEYFGNNRILFIMIEF